MFLYKEPWSTVFKILNAFENNKKKINKKVSLATELLHTYFSVLVRRLDILPVQYALFYIYIQKNNNDMNRQKADEKGIGRRK